MKLLELNCNHCGAPLEVPVKTRFLTCNFCSSKLAVQRSESAAYTEVLEVLEARTEDIARDVEVLKLEQRLARLDRDWEHNRKRYLVRDKHGVARIPTEGGTIFAAGLMLVFLVFFGLVASSINGLFILPAVLMGGLLFVLLNVQLRKARDFKKAKTRYQRRRRELTKELRQLSKAS